MMIQVVFFTALLWCALWPVGRRTPTSKKVKLLISCTAVSLLGFATGYFTSILPTPRGIWPNGSPASDALLATDLGKAILVILLGAFVSYKFQERHLRQSIKS
jgi:hypothetical protein